MGDVAKVGSIGGVYLIAHLARRLLAALALIAP
jgi:hypothetical protein